MPKGRKKGGRKSAESRAPSDEEYDTADNWSTASVLSDDLSGSIPEDERENEDNEESNAQENFEDKLKDAIDGITQKSAQGRKNCLDAIIKAFSKKYLYEFLQDRKVTVSDAVIRCLRKGKGDEQALAAKCISMLCIQLGLDAEELMSDVRPVLLTLLADKSANLKARGEAAIALAMCTFIASVEIEDVINVMESLEAIFRQSFKKGDGSIPTHSPEACRLHACALTAWGLLLSVAPQWLIDKMVLKYLSTLPDLLESQDIDLRIVCGETIALFYELGREEDEEFESDAMVTLCETLRKLSTESHKYWAKRDRRQQKSSFRDILRAVQDGEAPEMTVKFGSECLEIYSWIKKMQYSAFCQALTSGINQHLQWNPLVREVFGLGSPLLVTNLKSNKPTKWERTMYNAAAFKARTKARAKYRDKRSVMVNGGD
ncbi:Interferon-related developmental regulator 1 [Mactra antiquata]